MLKKNIREAFVRKRQELNDAGIEEKSAAILQQFRTLALSGIQVLLSYYPIPERREFDVSLCEQLLALDNNGLVVAWPRLLADDLTMEAIPVTKESVLVKNRYNIFEPDGDDTIDPQLIDAVFVPLLAFDSKGYRVGYGKGYYDRYLARCAQDTVKIGFSFFEALDAIDDIDEFDVPLNYCITPMRVYEF